MKWLAFLLIPIFLISLIVLTIKLIDSQSLNLDVTCSNGSSCILTSITVNAKIYGNSPSNSYGLGHVKGVFYYPEYPFLCPGFPDMLVEISSSVIYCAYCAVRPINGEYDYNFPSGLAGTYISSSAYNFCMDGSCSCGVIAFLSGQCGT